MIERVRDGTTYYTLPGGQLEKARHRQEAASRETHEELGLIVKLHGLVAVVHSARAPSYYYLR